MKTPRIIYKYFPLSCDEHLARVLNVISGRIYFSSPSGFNDPFEFNPVLPKITYEAVCEFLKDCDVNLSYNQKMRITNVMKSNGSLYRKLGDSWKEKFGVLCLTESYDNLLMWAHYASNHTGICIGFDIEYAPFATAKKIKYERLRPVIQEAELIGSSDDLKEKTFYTKSSHWEYEQELRCLTREVNDDEKQFYYDSVESGDQQVEDIIDLLMAEGGSGLYPFDNDAVRRIYFGSKIRSSYKQKIDNHIEESSCNPKVHSLALDHTYYRLKLA